MRNNQKGAIPLVLLIILLLLAGGGVYFASRSGSSKTAADMDAAPDMATTYDRKQLPSSGEAGGNVEKDSAETETREVARMAYRGTVLAGKANPLLAFAAADYEKAAASDKLIVLYFYANWCPICKAETANALYPAFDALMGDRVIGFRVNYNDSETDADERALARKFGVAYQHTKVFVKNGTRILKSPEGWDTARYLAEISKVI